MLKQAGFRRLGFTLALLGAAAASGCSHAKKKTPELSEMLGKKVALVDVDGEKTARSIVEVALINQLVATGSFVIISKQDVNAARVSPEINPADWKAIAKKAGADFALEAKVLKFDATTHEGYNKEIVEDSQLAEERGEDDRMTERVYKAKSIAGDVQVELQFYDLDKKDMRTGIAQAQETVSGDAKTEAIHLPPKLRFLEKLANQAFAEFFKQYR